jgi:hypothetical protein
MTICLANVSGARGMPETIVYGAMALPSFHAFGFAMQVCAPLASARPVAIFEPRSPPVVPNPENTLQAAIDTGTTVMPTVPVFLEVT